MVDRAHGNGSVPVRAVEDDIVFGDRPDLNEVVFFGVCKKFGY